MALDIIPTTDSNTNWSALHKWKYVRGGDTCYGEELVYSKAAEFLGDSCEDWGCGSGFARLFFKDYKGVDGSLGYVTEANDLVKYRSSADNIMIRQVLEHNYAWQTILSNAVASFQKKLFIGIHTPLGDKTRVLDVDVTNGIPNVSFCLDDVLRCLQPFKVRQEMILTNFEYGQELLLYVER